MAKPILYDITKTFFISDTHLYHKASILYMNRPFKDVEQMNEEIIKRWNSVVGEDDDVFHLGDFAFTGSIEKITELVSRLNGRIHRILGNHCYRNKLDRPIICDLFYDTCDLSYLHVKDGEKVIDVVLCHYPLEEWANKQYNSIHLHGHCHDANEIKIIPNRINVCVEHIDYTPKKLNELWK